MLPRPGLSAIDVYSCDCVAQDKSGKWGRAVPQLPRTKTFSPPSLSLPAIPLFTSSTLLAQTSRNKTQRKNGKPLNPKKTQDPLPHSLSNEYLFRFRNITLPFLLPFQQRLRVAWQIPSPTGPLGLSLWFARPWSFARVCCCTDILICSKRFAMSTIFCNASPLVREERASESGA